MPVPFRSHRLLAAGAALALTASFLVVGGAPAGAVTYPPIVVSKTTAHSGTDHGDSIDESGAGCSGQGVTGVVMWLAQGVVADSEPIGTNVVGTGNSALPDGEGNWSGTKDIPGGSNLALPAGQYTLRTACYQGDFVDFVYAGVVITINGDQESHHHYQRSGFHHDDGRRIHDHHGDHLHRGRAGLRGGRQSHVHGLATAHRLPPVAVRPAAVLQPEAVAGPDRRDQL